MVDLEPVDYTHDGTHLRGLLARPAGGAARAGVLVLHDAIGMGSLVPRKTAELAALGYVAFALDMYGSDLDPAKEEAYFGPFTALREQPQRLRDRAMAGLETLRTVSGIDPTRIGAVGYCFGGQCALELARGGAPLRAAISLHGLLTTRLPAQPGAVKAHVLAITGAHDPYAPRADVTAFEQEMADAGADWQVTLYGTGWHAFTDPEVGRRTDIPGVRYDALLDRLSWTATTDLLAAMLDG